MSGLSAAVSSRHAPSRCSGSRTGSAFSLARTATGVGTGVLCLPCADGGFVRTPAISKPQEELFSMGGALSEDCGYKMEPIVPFCEVLEKVTKRDKRS